MDTGRGVGDPAPWVAGLAALLVVVVLPVTIPAPLPVTEAAPVPVTIPAPLPSTEPQPLPAEGAAPRNPASRHPAAGLRESPGPLDELAFMVGCWRGEAYGGDGVVEERFTPAMGDMMLGVTRYLRGSAVEMFEFHRIQALEEGVVLVPYPRGRESVPFRLVVAAAGRAVFENPEHDFPVRIIYRRTDENTLVSRIEGADGGGAEWSMSRCDSGEEPGGR